jgi:hypothetical protein
VKDTSIDRKIRWYGHILRNEKRVCTKVLNLKWNGKCVTGRQRSRLEQEISKNIMQKGGRTRRKLRSSNFRKTVFCVQN